MKSSSFFKFSMILTYLVLFVPLVKLTFANDIECTKNSDCIKIDTVCDGVLAINKRYLQKFKDLKTKAEADSFCDLPNKAELNKNKNLSAICENKQCTLK